jgi:hypothetical protein
MATNSKDTVSRQISLPRELAEKLRSVAGYEKSVEEVIIECLQEAIRPRYEKWVKQEYEKITRRK